MTSLERDYEQEAQQLEAMQQTLDQYGPTLAPGWQIVLRVGPTDADANTNSINCGEIHFDFPHKVAIITLHPDLAPDTWQRVTLHEILHLSTIDLERAILVPMQPHISPKLYSYFRAAWHEYEDELIETLVRAITHSHEPHPITIMGTGDNILTPLSQEDTHYTYGL